MDIHTRFATVPFSIIMRSSVTNCLLLCVVCTLAPIVLGQTETPSLSFELFNDTMLDENFTYSHGSCSLLGDNYDIDYHNETFCTISPISNGNPYSSSFSPSTEIICPFDDMVISRIIFARWAKYYVPGPSRCESTSGNAFSQCSVPLSTMLTKLNPLCVGRNRCTVPATYAYWNHEHRMPTRCASVTPFISQIYSSFSFQCVKAPPTNCYLYDTFCHAFELPAPITGGLIKWEQPYNANLGGALNATANRACDGLISDDYHCLHYYGASSSYSNSFCSNRLTNVTFALTATAATSTDGSINLYLDDVLLGSFIVSQRYRSEYSVQKFVLAMPSTFVINRGRHYVTLEGTSLSSFGRAFYIRDFTMSTNVSDAHCLSSCFTDTQSHTHTKALESESESTTEVMSFSESPSESPPEPEIVTPSESHTHTDSPRRTNSKSRSVSHSRERNATHTRVHTSSQSHTKTHSLSKSHSKTHGLSHSHSNSHINNHTHSRSHTRSRSHSHSHNHTHSHSRSHSKSHSHSHTHSHSRSHSKSHSHSHTHSKSHSRSHSKTQSVTTTAIMTNSLSFSESATYSRSRTQSASDTLSQSGSLTHSESVSASGSMSSSDSMTQSQSSSQSESTTMSRSESNSRSSTSSMSRSMSDSESNSESSSRSGSSTQSKSTSESMSESSIESQSETLSESAPITMSPSQTRIPSHSQTATPVVHIKILGGVVGQVIFSVGILIFVCCTGCFLIILLIPRYRPRRDA